jgi:hypothetical protein
MWTTPGASAKGICISLEMVRACPHIQKTINQGQPPVDLET